MSEYDFAGVFAAMEEVESELKKAGSNKEKRQKCYDRLIELRKSMDRYVEFWLRFEEKLNELQDTYDFLLPDELPESLLTAFNDIMPENKDSNKESNKQAAPDRRKITPAGMPVNNEACIRSFRRGLGFMELAMMDEAIAEFRQVITLEPDLLLPHLCLGVAYAERGKADEAMRELRLVQALSTDPQTSAIVHNSLGNLYADSERYEMALPEFEKAVELDPEFAAAHFNMGAAYYNVKDYYKSLLSFEKVKSKFPKDWEIYFYLGKIHKRVGNDEEALVNLLKASYLAPQQPFVAFELGLLYDNLGEMRKALECYYRARKLYQEQERQETSSI
ncbi:MAG: tetratricopeptide repeat protein [Dethiobacter sp.]|jgi:tetratricopeptide (TPR) repeat protein|nr:tetratricopeptide repeat protein [Dethiobacter sp.]